VLPKFIAKIKEKNMFEENKYPNVFHTPVTTNHFTVWFTNSIEDVSFYDHVLHLLYMAEEGDVIDLMISSYGGSLDTLLALRSAIGVSQAQVTGHLLANASSAAGMLLLSCHNFVVNEFATFHAHTASYGSYGKTDDVKSQVDFITKQTEEIVRSVYRFILDDTEIQKLLDGKEFYFDHREISSRLQHREQKRTEEAQEEAVQQMKEFEETTFDYSELPLEELEEELQMYNEDIKKLKRAIADKKKQITPVVEQSSVKKKPTTRSK